MTTIALARPARTPSRERALLDATETCFGHYGDRGLTLRQITRHVGGSTESIYRIFGDRRGLVVACCDRAVTHVTTMIDDWAPSITVGRLELFSRDYVDEMSGRPGLHRMFMGDPPGEVDVDLMGDQRRRLLGLLAEATDRMTAEALLAAWDGVARSGARSGGEARLAQYMTRALLAFAVETDR